MDQRLVRIGRLTAVAQGLEREGAYNGAKLVRAALERELIRYAATEAPSGGQAAAEALDQLVTDLGPDLPAEIRALLPGVADHVREGSTIPLADAPRTRVCRGCGEVSLDEDVPAVCPRCASPPLAQREMYPIWFLEPATSGELLAALESGRRQLLSVVAGRSDERLTEQPCPGEWSARQTLEHLLFAERLFGERIGRLLDEDQPDLASRAVWTETPSADGGAAADDAPDPASELVARVADLRAANVSRLEGLTAAEWLRSGTHPEWGYGDLDGRSDIIWYTPGTGPDWLWTTKSPTGDPVFTNVSISVNGTYTPVVVPNTTYQGRPGTDHVVWYKPGAASEVLWTDIHATGSHVSTVVSVPGSPMPVIGDFDGDNLADIVWYAPGSAPDTLWWGHAGHGSFKSKSLAVNGTYQPVVGDFPPHLGGTSDILWWNPSGQDPMWEGLPGAAFDKSTVLSLGATSGKAVAMGAYVFFWSTSAPDLVWYPPPPNGFEGPTGNTELPSGYRTVIGDFVVERLRSILWYAPGPGVEVLFHATV